MENPLKMGWFGGYPYFRKHAYVQNIGEISESSTGSPPHRPKILLPVDQAPFDQRASKQNPRLWGVTKTPLCQHRPMLLLLVSTCNTFWNAFCVVKSILIGTVFFVKKMERFWHLARHVHSPSFINSVVEAIFIFGIPLLRNKFEYVTSWEWQLPITKNIVTSSNLASKKLTLEKNSSP